MRDLPCEVSSVRRVSVPQSAQAESRDSSFSQKCDVDCPLKLVCALTGRSVGQLPMPSALSRQLSAIRLSRSAFTSLSPFIVPRSSFPPRRSSPTTRSPTPKSQFLLLHPSAFIVHFAFPVHHSSFRAHRSPSLSPFIIHRSALIVSPTPSLVTVLPAPDT